MDELRERTSHAHHEHHKQEKNFVASLDISNPKDRETMRQHLLPILGEEAAEQFIFALQSFSVDGNDYTNQCHKATRALGESLIERTGGEESFFDLAPHASYNDVQSEKGTLGKVGYRGDFHSVGRIGVIDPTSGNEQSILVDATFSAISSNTKPMLYITVNGGIDTSLQALKETYGGKWHIESTLNPTTGTFRWSGDA